MRGLPLALSRPRRRAHSATTDLACHGVQDLVWPIEVQLPEVGVPEDPGAHSAPNGIDVPARRQQSEAAQALARLELVRGERLVLLTPWKAAADCQVEPAARHLGRVDVLGIGTVDQHAGRLGVVVVVVDMHLRWGLPMRLMLRRGRLYGQNSLCHQRRRCDELEGVSRNQSLGHGGLEIRPRRRFNNRDLVTRLRTGRDRGKQHEQRSDPRARGETKGDPHASGSAHKALTTAAGRAGTGSH
eukprot:scaffold2298_cov146-Isochrysis_galbana.AAC.4